MNVLSACADPDTDTWTKWLAQALGLNPDLNALNDSGGDRFATIDIKMAMGMQNMLRQAPDEAKDVYLDATRHSELRHQQGVIVKGRELVALVMQSFRTSDRTDLNCLSHRALIQPRLSWRQELGCVEEQVV